MKILISILLFLPIGLMAQVTSYPVGHIAEMHFYASAGTQTVGVADQYHAINGEFSAGDLQGFTFTAGSNGGGIDIVTIAAGDRIYVTFKNTTDTQDLEYENGSLIITKL